MIPDNPEVHHHRSALSVADISGVAAADSQARPSAARHIVALDSLRGIAAMVVVLGHCTLVFSLPPAFRMVSDIVLNQRAAVLIFFVLSGYVLAHSWQRIAPERSALLRFYVRRAFRLMPALWIAPAISLVLLYAFPLRETVGHQSQWFIDSYSLPSLRRQVSAFLAIDNAVVPPTWTITIELLGSLLVPFFVVAINRGKWWTGALMATCFCATFAFAELHSRLAMGAFVLEFAIGCVLAIGFWRGRTMSPALLGMAAVAILLAARPLVWVISTGTFQLIEYRINAPFPAIMETVGAAMLVLALASPGVHVPFLEWAPVKKLGEWSYSIYLIHFPIVRIAGYFLPPMPPIQSLAVLTAIVMTVTCFMSMLIYRYIELPGISLGKRLTSLPLQFAKG